MRKSPLSTYSEKVSPAWIVALPTPSLPSMTICLDCRVTNTLNDNLFGLPCYQHPHFPQWQSVWIAALPTPSMTICLDCRVTNTLNDNLFGLPRYQHPHFPQWQSVFFATVTTLCVQASPCVSSNLQGMVWGIGQTLKWKQQNASGSN